MLEFPRSYCLYHPTELITNFCRERACLLPLCPSCVCSHVDFHVKRGGQLKFDNIHQTYHNCNKTINQFSDKLDEDRRKANSLQSSIDRLYSKVSDIIFQAKLEVRELIDKKFQELEKETMKTVAKHCEASGLHSKQKIALLEQKIGDGQKQIAGILKDLKSDRSLATVILFNGEKKAEFQKILVEIDREFQLNYEFDPRITINNDAFEIFSKGVSQLLEIKINLPEQLKAKLVPPERPTLVRNSSRDSLERQPLGSIINKRSTPTQQQMLYFNNTAQNNKLMISRLRSPSTAAYYSPSTIVKPVAPTVVHLHHYSVYAPPTPTKKTVEQCDILPQDSVLTSQNSGFRKTERPVSKSKRGLSLHTNQRHSSIPEK